MSNLNINNLDVQRIINVLTELISKIDICSIFTFKTIEKIKTNQEELKELIKNEEFWEDLEEHFKLMKSFKETHLIIIEKLNNNERNSELRDEDDFIDLEEHNVVQEIIREKENLSGIEEKTSEITKALAKNIRAICRKYYKHKELIEVLKSFRIDSEIIDFCEEFQSVLYHHNKKVKMTLEEEKSDMSLNKYLTAKIIDLENQINDKQFKYEKLKRERTEFKNKCIEDLNSMDDEIKMLQQNTEHSLNEFENKINTNLNNVFESSEVRTNALKEKLQTVQGELDKKKKENEDEEKKLILEYKTGEDQLKDNIGEYDLDIKTTKETLERLNKENDHLKIEMNEKKNLRDQEKEKFETYEKAFERHMVNINELNYNNNVKVKASEWIQGQFRGYITRKVLRKKYKFLAVLRKPKIEPPNLNDKKGRNNKNKR